MPNPFAIDGNWYKGNLHTHTTASDGDLSPQETIRLYAEEGYDFLALTDHDVLSDYDGLDPRGLMLISGCEIEQATGGGLGQALHIVALGLEALPHVAEIPTYAETVAAVAGQCQLCFIAHPFYTLLTPGELLNMRGHVGVEVCNNNGTCWCWGGRGTAEYVWDILLAHGRRLWGFAGDDAHHRKDYGCTWVMAKSTENSAEAIMAALIRGDFYASNGPGIRDLRIEGDEVVVQCSGCREVGLIETVPEMAWKTARLDAESGAGEVHLPLRSRERPFRVQVTDERGLTAWTNPVFPEEMQ